MKNFLLTVSLVAIASFSHAQYLVSATELMSKSGAQIYSILTYNWHKNGQVHNRGLYLYFLQD